MNNSEEFLKDLANEITSFSLILFVVICNSSKVNFPLIKDFKAIFVLICSSSIFLLIRDIFGSKVFSFIVKLYGSNKSLTLFNSKLILLLTFKI